ncbi:MAG: SlyX family protein [Halieaceae bacterium]
MSEETELTRLQAQLVELQTQVAFQEETITELSGALGAQQQDLALLRRQWELLQESYAEMQRRGSGEGLDTLAEDPARDKPPHY